MGYYNHLHFTDEDKEQRDEDSCQNCRTTEAKGQDWNLAVCLQSSKSELLHLTAMSTTLPLFNLLLGPQGHWL
jgi:hypothetical protein